MLRAWAWSSVLFYLCPLPENGLNGSRMFKVYRGMPIFELCFGWFRSFKKHWKHLKATLTLLFCVHWRQAFLNVSMSEIQPHVLQAFARLFLLVLHAVDGCKWLGWLLQVCRDPICPNNSSPRRTVGMGSHFPPQPRRFHCHAGVGAAEQALPNGDC